DDGYVKRGFEHMYDAQEDDACQYNNFAGLGIRCRCPEDRCNNYNCEECKGLACYSCIDCPTVGENTTTVFDENFLTCTVITTDQGFIVRGGGFDAYDDGECFVNGLMTECHCTTSLCNNA
ncbi:unnamed protein product, partial [Meganyctiphanes norvegica]